MNEMHALTIIRIVAGSFQRSNLSRKLRINEKHAICILAVAQHTTYKTKWSSLEKYDLYKSPLMEHAAMQVVSIQNENANVSETSVWLRQGFEELQVTTYPEIGVE